MSGFTLSGIKAMPRILNTAPHQIAEKPICGIFFAEKY
jgi:hypothetical protein